MRWLPATLTASFALEHLVDQALGANILNSHLKLWNEQLFRIARVEARFDAVIDKCHQPGSDHNTEVLSASPCSTVENDLLCYVFLTTDNAVIRDPH